MSSNTPGFSTVTSMGKGFSESRVENHCCIYNIQLEPKGQAEAASQMNPARSEEQIQEQRVLSSLIQELGKEQSIMINLMLDNTQCALMSHSFCREQLVYFHSYTFRRDESCQKNQQQYTRKAQVHENLHHPQKKSQPAPVGKNALKETKHYL